MTMHEQYNRMVPPSYRDGFGKEVYPVQICIHGHFYQPPRDNPFTGEIPPEMGAEPYANFNEKINAECYRPNALAGNFERISFNVGPTLAMWIEQHDPETYARIIASDRLNYERYGFGNALAQNYNHVILPLAKPEDARLQIEWGIMDFERRFGHKPEGMWLAETGASTWVLDLLAQAGIKFVILAPWQADAASVETINLAERAVRQSHLRQQAIDRWRSDMLHQLQGQGLSPEAYQEKTRQVLNTLPLLPERVPEPYDVSEPYYVELPEGRRIVAFFYNGKLSGDISFNQDATADADRYARQWLANEINHAKLNNREPQILMVATDGELYGHHQPYRDHFLRHLTETSVQAAGLKMTFPSLYLRDYPPHRRIRIHENSSWSCHHGVARWSTGCYCTPGNSAWKASLRESIDLLAAEVDRIYAMQAPRLFHQTETVLRDFLFVWQGLEPPENFLNLHLKQGSAASPATRTLALRFLKSQFYKHQMYTSCAWFFEDVDRIEPKNALAAASIIFRLLGKFLRPGVLAEFESTLLKAVSQHTGLSAAQLYRRGIRWASKNGFLSRKPATRPVLAPVEVLGGEQTDEGRVAVA